MNINVTLVGVLAKVGVSHTVYFWIRLLIYFDNLYSDYQLKDLLMSCYNYYHISEVFYKTKRQ